MEFAEYQKQAGTMAQYPGVGDNFVYPTLGLAEEVGEVTAKVKKLLQNEAFAHATQVPEEKRLAIAKDMGDVLWFLTQLGTELGISLEDIARLNIEKLTVRKAQGVLLDEGDTR